MRQFSYQNPTTLWFGQGSIEKLNEKIDRNARVLLVYGGKSAKDNGSLAKTREALGNRVVLEYGGIEPNPDFSTCVRAAKLAAANQVNYILALGGGSVIDAAKFIAVIAANNVDPWELLLNNNMIKGAIPVGCIVTLPAAGAETTPYCVISRREYRVKIEALSSWFFPRFAILDPALTLSLPERQAVNGYVDSFVHILEYYLNSTNSSEVSDCLAEALLKLIIEQAPKALLRPSDITVRGNLMWASTLALQGLIHCGQHADWATHHIGHEITALYDIDHARTLAVVLPGVLEASLQFKQEKLARMATRVWGIDRGSPSDRAQRCIDKIEGFFNCLGVSTRLSDYKLDAKCIEKILQSLQAHQLISLGENRNLTLDVVRDLLISRL